MSDTRDAARLREALTIVLKESAGLTPPPLEDSVLVARLHAACASFRDRPRLTPQELLSLAQGDRFEPVFRDLLLETFSDKDTAFNRDKQMFSYIAENLLIPKPNAKRPLKIWCAACSTGQEALSLVMAWHKRLQGEPALAEAGTRFVVYASDMSARAVEMARKGRYNNFDVQHGLNVHDLLEFFDEQQGGGFWKAKDTLLAPINFFQHNLLNSPPSLLPRRLDAILLPHTLHNFDDTIAERVLVRLVSLLAPEGWLVLAPFEAEKYGRRLFLQPSGRLEESSSLPQGMFSRSTFAYPDRAERHASAQGMLEKRTQEEKLPQANPQAANPQATNPQEEGRQEEGGDASAPQASWMPAS